MTKIAYRPWNPQSKTYALLDIAGEIIIEYRAQGYTLTLRQLYYQLVARDIIPNKERSYKNLSNTITKARMAGMIDWEAIEDRNRSCSGYLHEEDPLEPIRTLPHAIQFDQWARQEDYVEVWVEKEALGNVISKACNPYMVPHMSCKGYLSASEAWRAGRRFMRKLDQGKRCHLIHLGDHDPSGLDMTRDNRERIDIFSELPGGVEVDRIALNMDQVKQYDPPPNPTKLTDSRSGDYVKRFGRSCWELDALKPEIMVDLIQGKITEKIDFAIWNSVNEKEEEVKDQLRQIADNYDEILEFVDNGQSLSELNEIISQLNEKYHNINYNKEG
ncbi:MAG: hypothetical protein KAV87_27075 [Desulfobacteraceae bacterium]|nr:hypothetical protein [Desulfobacteraceae bacterium]